MKIFRNKFLVKLIATLCLFLTLINIGGATKVYSGWGGILITPIVNLFTAIADSIMETLHASIQEQKQSVLLLSGATEEKRGWSLFGAIVVGILAAVAVVAAIVLTGGLIAAAGTAIGLGMSFSFGFGTVAFGAVVGIMAGTAVYKEWIPDDLYLPVFSITAEEIFANEIHLFDVNFFDPKPTRIIERVEQETVTLGGEDYYGFIKVYVGSEDDTKGGVSQDKDWTDGIDRAELIFSEEYLPKNRAYANIIKYIIIESRSMGSSIKPTLPISEFKTLAEALGTDEGRVISDIITKANKALAEKSYPIINKITDRYFDTTYQSKDWEDYAYFEYYDYSHPKSEAYYMGKLEVKLNRDTSVNIVFGVKYDDSYYEETREEVIETVVETVTLHSTARNLSEIISKWYFILRNIALLVLMLVLIYSGIKIVMGSTAGEKAKYKERLMDWLIAMCLIFIMHYIMAFSVQLVAKITELVRDTAGLNANGMYIELKNDAQKESAKKILQNPEYTGKALGELDGDNLLWYTDLAGLFKLQGQLTGEGTSKWVGYSLCYLVLVLYTLFFAWTYLKRVVYMAFLTMIAPLVAMTYPIDKMTDGKAQAFDAWLKEYIFNLMIQPLHLLLYAMLVSSAFELATNSPLYALVAIGFMTPAEKLMRKFFGFEKARTPGLLGGAAGAALAMSGVQSLMRPKHHSGKGDNGGKTKEQNNVKFANKNRVNTMEAIGGEPTGIGPTNPSESSQDANNGRIGIKEKTSRLSEEAETNNNALLNSMQNDNNISNNVQYDLENVDPISTFEATKAARAAYNKKPELRSFDKEKKANLEKRKEERKRRIKAVSGAVLSSTGRQLAGKALTGIHPLRLAGKIATGATAATAGLLLGVASGDPSKAFQYTTTGAVAGSKFAESLSGRQVLDTQQIKQEAEMAYYGEAYKKKVIEDQRKEFQKNASYINYLRQTMGIGKEEAKEILDTTGGQCFDNGITNIEDIATIHKLTNGENSMSFNQAVAARNYAKKRLPSNPDQMTQDTVREYIKRWGQEYTKAGYANGEDLAKKSFDLAIRFNKAQSSLTKNP